MIKVIVFCQFKNVLENNRNYTLTNTQLSPLTVTCPLITQFLFMQPSPSSRFAELTHSPSGTPGGLRALRWWWLSHQQGWWRGPWGKGDTAPHLDDIPQRLEALIAATLHQQGHGEVASLEPLAHLHGGKWTCQKVEGLYVFTTAVLIYLTSSTCTHCYLYLLVSTRVLYIHNV